MLGRIAAFWGVFGFALLLSSAIGRLAPFALDLPFADLSVSQWLALALSLIFMGFSEGYRGFQQNFSPRFAARVRFLRENVTPVRALLAPLFCMGFFYTTPKRRIVSYSLTLMIIVLILTVRYLPQPWRGIVDAGVVFGLAWGLLSILLFTFRALTESEFGYSPETPCNNTSA